MKIWPMLGSFSNVSRMFSPTSRLSIFRLSPMAPLMSSRTGSMVCFREKASSCRVSSVERCTARRMSCKSSCWGCAGGSARVSMVAQCRMIVSWLLKSWATPPASRPIASIRAASRFCASSVTSWVTSRLTATKLTVLPEASTTGEIVASSS